MAHLVMKNFGGPGQLVVWNCRKKPSLQEVLDVVSKEFPNIPLSEIHINDSIMLTKGRMFQSKSKAKIPA